MPRAIEGYLIGYSSSDKIYRIYIPWQLKVTETQQIYWTTKTFTPRGTTMEPLLGEEICAIVYPLSLPLATTTIEKHMNQNWSRQIIPPTSKEPSATQPSKEISFIEDSLRVIPEPLVIPSSLPAQN